MIAILDCGTTNTKCYVVDEQGKLLAEGYSGFGVKDNGLKDDREDYKKALRQVVKDTCSRVEGGFDALEKVIGFGMISSDLGLVVVPHLTVPAGLEDFQREVYRVETGGIFPEKVSFYLIRGVKNDLPSERALENVEICDFMRGEETQVMGILEKYHPGEACNVIMFGSHFKIIHVSADGRILQSMTTMSGQVFECISRYTVVSSSVDVRQDETMNMSVDKIIELAGQNTEHRGLMRTLLLPRFMESFTEMTAAERRLYLDAVIALEDMKAIREYYADGCYRTKKYFFIGQEERCSLFARILKKADEDVEIEILGGREKNRDVSIAGALKITENR